MSLHQLGRYIIIRVLRTLHQLQTLGNVFLDFTEVIVEFLLLTVWKIAFSMKNIFQFPSHLQQVDGQKNSLLRKY